MIYNTVTIESIYQYIDNEPLWAETKNYLQSNSDVFITKRVEIEKFNTDEAIGGFAETMLISIVSSLVYDLGKHIIIDLLKKLKEPVNIEKYMEETPPKFAVEGGYPGVIDLKVQFKDNKTVFLQIPFPIDSYNSIDKIDFDLIENQFLYDNTAKLAFNKNTAKYCKGSIYDYFA